jgi:hypothetical protein
LIKRLVEVLDAEEDELLMLAGKIRQRELERPEAFRRLAELNDAALDRLLDQLNRGKGR